VLALEVGAQMLANESRARNDNRKQSSTDDETKKRIENIVVGWRQRPSGVNNPSVNAGLATGASLSGLASRCE